jgi:hypothetical protein
MVTYKVDLANGRTLTISYKDVNRDRLMIFLPGVSGNSMSDRFKYLDTIALNCGYSLVKMDYQFQQYNDMSLSIKDCMKDILAVLEYLKRRDINTAKEKIIIAKSFGGLLYHLLDMDITKGILLAPYTRLEDKPMNFLDTKLSDAKHNSTYLNKKLLRDNPTLIFHGTHDQQIDIKNSEEMTEAKNNYNLIKVDSDHGLDEDEVHKLIIKRVTEFIKD